MPFLVPLHRRSYDRRHQHIHPMGIGHSHICVALSAPQLPVVSNMGCALSSPGIHHILQEDCPPIERSETRRSGLRNLCVHSERTRIRLASFWTVRFGIKCMAVGVLISTDVRGESTGSDIGCCSSSQYSAMRLIASTAYHPLIFLETLLTLERRLGLDG